MYWKFRVHSSCAAWDDGFPLPFPFPWVLVVFRVGVVGVSPPSQAHLTWQSLQLALPPQHVSRVAGIMQHSCPVAIASQLIRPRSQVFVRHRYLLLSETAAPSAAPRTTHGVASPE